ncbi:hypothetical protein U3653_06360 [Nocardia sp. CDC186]|uniref:Uncharacterized protein n=1 Tax=Nocardia implantans TaxID=3108168 RepID=A0ABU6AQJ0_9NOCA|nr:MULTISPECIES: hypothetical protein [unclassified Nocardia]MBF6189980.1 hypothetical protein [Nocardia beijingensis]MEA3526787.1 hypothetical protein [Nocardia sp. CDC192]MEB3509636.1 hypothetical protein [Nocardia sp. CDC186]
MSQPSRIDTGELRAMVSTLERLIADASRTVGQLKAAIASAEGLVGGDPVDHAEASPVLEPAVFAAESSPEPKAMPTPWSRKNQETPWSRRVVRPCPTVQSTPVHVSAPREIGVPPAEVSAPARRLAPARHSEFQPAGRRTDAVDERASVRRAVAADGPPPAAAAASSRGTDRGEHSVPRRRTDAASAHRTDTPDGSPPDGSAGAAPSVGRAHRAEDLAPIGSPRHQVSAPSAAGGSRPPRPHIDLDDSVRLVRPEAPAPAARSGSAPGQPTDFIDASAATDSAGAAAEGHRSPSRWTDARDDHEPIQQAGAAHNRAPARQKDIQEAFASPRHIAAADGSPPAPETGPAPHPEQVPQTTEPAPPERTGIADDPAPVVPNARRGAPIEAADDDVLIEEADDRPAVTLRDDTTIGTATTPPPGIADDSPPGSVPPYLPVPITSTDQSGRSSELARIRRTEPEATHGYDAASLVPTDRAADSAAGHVTDTTPTPSTDNADLPRRMISENDADPDIPTNLAEQQAPNPRTATTLRPDPIPELDAPGHSAAEQQTTAAPNQSSGNANLPSRQPMINADDSLPHRHKEATEQTAPAQAATTPLPEPSGQIDATDHPAAEQQTTATPDHSSGNTARSQPTSSIGDSAPDPPRDTAEQAASVPAATAPGPQIDATDDCAAERRAGSAPGLQADATDEPVSRRTIGNAPGSAAWLDALRFSWLDSPNGSPPAGAGTTDASGHQAGSPPGAGEAGSVAQQLGSTDNSGARRSIGHPSSGGRSDPAPEHPGTAPNRKPDAADQPTQTEVSATGHPRHAADDADSIGIAKNPTRSPRTDVTHPHRAASAATSAENSTAVHRSESATPRRTGSTGGVPVQRPGPASPRKHERALIERGDSARRPAVSEQTDAPDPFEALRIAREMSARHGVEVVGFDTANVDLQVIREIASAIDELLTKYPMPLRGVELTADTEPRPRPERDPTAAQSADAPIWLLLDHAALSPPRSAPVETRRIFRRRGPAERPVYTAVVREFAGALDVAGAFRARQEALRTLINESLRGGGGGLGLLDPGRALIDGFTEVVLRGERASATAKELHGALVKMARVESSDDLSA